MSYKNTLRAKNTWYKRIQQKDLLQQNSISSPLIWTIPCACSELHHLSSGYIHIYIYIHQPFKHINSKHTCLITPTTCLCTTLRMFCNKIQMLITPPLLLHLINQIIQHGQQVHCWFKVLQKDSLLYFINIIYYKYDLFLVNLKCLSIR